MCAGFLLCTLLALIVSVTLLRTYTHAFTPYLKWQDALVALLWFVSFLGLSGSILIVRFLATAHAGYKQGMLSLLENTQLAVRDISSGNLGSIFWMMNAGFWCFVAVLVGLVPVILIGWTLHLSPLALALFATGLAVLLSLAGLAVSAVGGSFIVIGFIGAFSFSQKLGATHTYKMNSQLTIRRDGSILTIIYPDMQESMLDLNSFNEKDQHLLLSLLRERWHAAQQAWTLELGDDDKRTDKDARQNIVMV